MKKATTVQDVWEATSRGGRILKAEDLPEFYQEMDEYYPYEGILHHITMPSASSTNIKIVVMGRRSGISAGLLWLSEELKKVDYPVKLVDVCAEWDGDMVLELAKVIWNQMIALKDVYDIQLQPYQDGHSTDEVQGFIDRSNRIADEIQKKTGKDPVIILDNLNRMIEERYDSLWSNRHEWINHFRFPVVFTATPLEHTAKWFRSAPMSEMYTYVAPIGIGWGDKPGQQKFFDYYKGMVEKRMDISLFEEGALEFAIRFTEGPWELLEVIHKAAHHAIARYDYNYDATDSISMEDIRLQVVEHQSMITRFYDSKYDRMFAYARNTFPFIDDAFPGTVTTAMLRDGIIGGALLRNQNRLYVHPQMLDFMAEINLGLKHPFFDADPTMVEEGYWVERTGLGIIHPAFKIKSVDDKAMLVLRDGYDMALVSETEFLNEKEKAEKVLRAWRAYNATLVSTLRMSAWEPVIKILMPLAVGYARTLKQRDLYERNEKSEIPSEYDLTMIALSAATTSVSILMNDKQYFIPMRELLDDHLFPIEECLDGIKKMVSETMNDIAGGFNPNESVHDSSAAMIHELYKNAGNKTEKTAQVSEETTDGE